MEVHSVTTEDGYILELHRIPYGKRNVRDSNSTTQKYGRPVFLQHGLMATDHFWLFNPSNSSLGIPHIFQRVFFHNYVKSSNNY